MKKNNQMFTKEQRSWQLPDESIWVYGFFSFVSSIFVQKPEQLLVGPFKQTTSGLVVQTWSWWLPPSGLLGGGPLEVPDLFDQVSLFIVELLVLRSVVLELAEKLDEFGLVLQQDVQDGLRLVGVGHKHLMVEEHDKDVNMYIYCLLRLMLTTVLGRNALPVTFYSNNITFPSNE